MKPVVEFLSELRHLQVKLWIDEGRLRYSAPQGTMTPDLLEQMRSHKSEILEFLQQLNPDTPEPIKLISREQDLPLSFAQESLWFLDQLEGKNAAYNMAMAFRLKGNLNLSALEQAIKLLISRHEILRTNIATRNGIPVTIVQGNYNFSLPLIDLQNSSADDQETEVQKFINTESLQPFDLENDSLIRGNLLRLKEQEYILLLTLHHIISDGWSINLLHRELGILYSVEQQGTPSPLPELPIQYIDFAYWQRERFAGEFLQKQLSYWKQQLENAPPLLELPTDYSRPAIQTFSGAKHIHQLSRPLSEGIKTLSQREGTTLFMTLLTAFNILLSRYTGTEDIVVGSPVAGRTRPELEALIGFFINTVVLRTRWENNPSFRELLAKVKDVTLGAYEHQEMPFEKLVKELQPERNLSYNPLFQVWFNMINLAEEKQELPGLTVEIISTAEATAKFDITLYVSEKTQGIEIEWVYNRDLFNPETITGMAERFQTLLENILIKPEQPIANLSLLSSEERQRLCNARNTVCPHQPFIEFPKPAIEQSITARFEEQVRKYADKIAIHTKNHQWIYRELNLQANKIAQALLEKNPNTEAKIALLFDHDAPMIAAILGVLKAGQTYIPLDPQYPKDRVSYILEDSLAQVVLTNHTNLVDAQKLTEGKLPIINIDDLNINDYAVEIHQEISPDTLAYILYTSGSTGKPKGVIQNHRNVLHFIRNYTNNLHISPDDKLTLLASYSFDAAVMDIFGALLNGATLYPIDIKIETFNHLANSLKQEEITIYHSTPTVYQHFLESLPQTKESENSFPQIRLIVMGGEEVVKKDVDLYKQHFSPDCIFVNGLGPTESTVTLQYFINQQTGNFGNLIPVGYPIEETEILLINKLGFDAELYGEIAIRSPYIALGYWQKPQLTQAVFLPDPEGGNRRIYRTGDLGRLRYDGTIEFLGRKDFQVKIRGFRIELGEIEATLIQHPSIRKTVVIALSDNSGDKRLVAYFVADSESLPTALELRDFLKDRLPNYMIPSVFVMLDSLPLTPNGKVNRLALPLPDFTSDQSHYVTPRFPTEEILVNLWSQVLKLENIGIYDNFFELGGHSLLATIIISRIRQTFNLELPLRLLFESPTIAQIAQYISTNSQSENLAVLTIEPRQQQETLPLSFSQQRLWFLDQLQPNSSAYNIPYRLQIHGLLNINALEKSLSQIIQRHEILHTNFLSIDGQPTQIINKKIDLNLSIIDLQFLSDEQWKIEAQRIANQETEKPFNLGVDYLFRVKLLRFSDQENLLLFNIHHIIFDGWSFGVLFAELKALYTAYCEGLTSPLPPLTIQYADFTLWQRQWLSREVLESQLNYWQQQLGGKLPILELPTDRPRPRLQTYIGATKSFILSPELTANIKSLSQKEGVTLFMTLLAAFKVLLCRYSGQEDVIVGTPIAGRNRTEIEGLMGFFVNTLALRSDLAHNPSFRELLSRVRQVTLGAYAHQDLPFEKLIEELQPERYLSHTPVFQVMFVLQNAPLEELQLPGLTLTALAPPRQTAKFDLTLSMMERNGQLMGEWEYNTDLFDGSRIQRMMEHFQMLLSGILAAPNQCIWELPLLTEAERHQLLVAWNQTETNYPQYQCIHELFEKQVERTPDAVAVVFENEELTYRELNQRANQLANYLQILGVSADKLVGLCLEPSLGRIIGLLGILKAGGVYLPLDPVYPQERLKFMMEDSQVSILLTQESLAASLATNSLQVVNLDTDWKKISTEPTNNLQSCVTGENLAYVIYTSGSTGIPKGVLIEHQAIAHHCQNIIEHYQLNSSDGDRILQFASLSFDVSLEQILPTLAVGATLILADAKLLTGLDFHQKLIDYRLTVVDIPPAYWTQWLQSLEEKAFVTPINQLRLVICGGEALPPEGLKIWQNSSMRGVRLINAYGPTETTITAITFAVPQEITSIQSHTNIPIGRPLPNRKVYIFDHHKNLVPIGVTGELYIGGESLARGYLNRPELTADKFVANPFDNSKLYKTGDLACYLPDGNIKFLGRIDNQVKIRGFRIELGEIEAVLNQHPTIRETKVITREDIPGNQRLVAYIIPNSAKDGTVNEEFTSLKSDISHQIREYLKKKLPDYMVPSAFVVLETFPLTTNGKIDYRALPAPDFSSSQSNYVAPRTLTEEILANLWSEILKVETIGIYDNFFELGGHSLLATQVISQIRQVFKLELPLRLLFEFPTIAQFSSQIGKTDSLAVAVIEPRKQQENLPLSFAQQRLWFLDQLEPNSSAYNMSYRLRLLGSLNISALEKSIDEIIKRHEILHTNFISVDGQPSQVITDNIAFNLLIINLQLLPDEQRELEAQKIVNEETEKPFNLIQDSLFRVKLLRLSAESHLLLITIHHIIFDGWSDHVFLRELAALYQAFSTGNPSTPLPTLSIQYADFALWQRHWLTGEVLESQLNYWKQQLGGTLPVLELPTDYSRPRVQTYQGASHSLNLSPELTASIKSLSRKEGVTLFMTLLAGFKILLCRYSGQEDVIVGTPIAGRNRREIEDLIGFFINTLALRTDLSGNPSFRELLSRVRQVTLGAYAHQDLPFEKLVEELQPERDLSHTPLFQVWFNMVNLEENSLELNGLKVEPVSGIKIASKFDLSLYISEENNQINLRFVYNKVLFNADTIQWMGRHFQQLLEGISANPEKPISRFSILTETERYQLSHQRNLISPTNSFREFQKHEIEQSIPARFEEQVKKYPHKIAIHTKNHQWTYQELNSQINRIAQALLQENNYQEAKIALLFDHDAPMIAAILGVLKAGKTYVPLDPKYPQDRILYILEDSQAQLVLTNHKNLLNTHQLIKDKLPIINIDDININDEQVNIDQEISPDTIAYLLYTSGSTGKPKGVIQNHRNVLHFIRNYTNNLHISPDDKLSLFASYSFDAAIIDIFSALLNGASLYPFDIKTEGLAHLSAWLEEQEITIYHFTPTVYRSFMQILTEKESIVKIRLSQVRLVVLGGEEVVKSDVELYQKYFDDECILVNGLGSTESSFNLQYLIDKKMQITEKFVPVGYPFDDTEILLLDDMGNHTDICGEIAIRSSHIALGYWQKPELTTSVFLDDPQGGNKRIYRTGDLGRLRENGVIECLGRKDFQVKIRGFRIELGEIEATLIQHPSVQKTVVIAREDIPGEKRLVAYIIPRENEASIKEIKQYLKQKLPDYMVPAAFVVLDVLPLTPNGKINRLALPAPNFTNFESAEYTTTSDNLELQLTKIWENVLGIHPIGLNDNFFDVGGHSLLAVKLFAQIEKIFGKNIPLSTLFQSPTIRQLANMLRQAGYSSSWSSLVPIQTNGSKPALFYVHTLSGGLIHSHNLLSKLDADQPVYGLQAQGLDGRKSPHTCIADMASHYIQEIQTVQLHGPYLLGGWCAGGMIAYEMAQQFYAKGETVGLLTILDAYPPRMISQSKTPSDCLSLHQIKSSFYQSILYFSDMVKRNYSLLVTLKVQQQIIAIQEKINRRIQDIIKEIIYQFYLKRNLPLPHEFRHLAVRDAIALAYKNYCPKVYAGKVIFFRAVDQPEELTDYLKKWEELAAGGLEIYDIPGHHDSIMSEPHVSVLAERLRACIEIELN